MRFKSLNILTTLIRSISSDSKLIENLNDYLITANHNIELKLPEQTHQSDLTHVCSRAAEKLNYIDRNLIFLRLIEFLHCYYNLKEFSDEIETIKDIFQIDYVKNYLDIFNNHITENDFYRYRTIHITPSQNDNLDGLWVDENKPKTSQPVYRLYEPEINASVYIIYMRHLNVFLVKTFADQDIYFNQNRLRKNYFEIFTPTDILLLHKQRVIDFLDIKKIHLEQNNVPKLSLEAKNISFTQGKKQRLKPLNLHSNEGELIAIHGYDSSGKSSVMNIIAGLVKPDTGSVKLNGYNYKTNWYLLRRIIGFVPAKDLLFDELTVYQNLYYYCKLYLSHLTKVETEIKINELLKKLDLSDIKHKVAGSVKDNNINPGKRKLINIAFELLKDPSVLLIDDIITDLNDAETQLILDILKNECLAGKIVITSINHTFQQTLMNFDKLYLLDYSGYLIYEGRPSQLTDYIYDTFLGEFRQIENQDQNQHISVLNLINTPKYDAAGFVKETRAIPPADLHNVFTEKQKPKNHTKIKEVLPLHSLQIPKLEVQLKYFFLRNLTVKLSSFYDIIIAILVAIILAFTTGILIKDPLDVTSYTDNQNILHYYFIIFIIAFGLGLFISALEIYRERYIIGRETLLGLSWFSFINAKIFILSLIVGLLLIPYVIFTQLMIHHPAFMIQLYIISISMAINGLLSGLIISSLAVNYFRLNISIIILFMLQLLFGGGMTLNKSYVYNQSKVQHITNLTPIRWAMEAMVVQTATKNDYDINVYPVEYKLNMCQFYLETGIPYLVSKLEYESDQHNNYEIIANELELISNHFNVFPFEFQDSLRAGSTNNEVSESLDSYLTYLYYFFTELNEKLALELNTVKEDETVKSFYPAHNILLYNVASLKPEFEISEKEKFKLKNTGIFHIPHNSFGKSPIFSATKLLSNQPIPTFNFNVLIIWLMNLTLYVLLLLNPLRVFKKWDA